MIIHLNNTKGKFLLSLLYLLTACTEVTEKEGVGTQPNLNVEAFKVIPQAFDSEIKSTADILPSEQVELMAPMAGQVLEIYFKEGARVEKGSKIIRIYDKNWQAELVGLKAQLESAEKDLARKKALLEIEGSSQEEIDVIFADSETLKSQIQQLQLNIELANVRAPFSGTLGMRDFSKGAFLKEGELITTLTELKQLKVNFTLPQEYLSSVKLNTNVHLLVSTDTLMAKIYAINPVIDLESRTINVRALLQQPSGKKIMPGSFAEVLVSANQIENALLVPTQAVVPEINDQTLYVYKNGKAIRQTVELGNRTADMVHIIHGISAGDTIITSGLLQIKDGMGIDLQVVK